MVDKLTCQDPKEIGSIFSSSKVTSWFIFHPWFENLSLTAKFCGQIMLKSKSYNSLILLEVSHVAMFENILFRTVIVLIIYPKLAT